MRPAAIPLAPSSTPMVRQSAFKHSSRDNDSHAAINKKSDVKRFDTSCFDGDYITGDIDETYLYYIDALRNDMSKQTEEEGNVTIELHNDV